MRLLKSLRKLVNFSIILGDEKVSLMDWDDKVDLEKIFGNTFRRENGEVRTNQ